MDFIGLLVFGLSKPKFKQGRGEGGYAQIILHFFSLGVLAKWPKFMSVFFFFEEIFNKMTIYIFTIGICILYFGISHIPKAKKYIQSFYETCKKGTAITIPFFFFFFFFYLLSF